MRFLADMGVSQRVVEWLRTQGHDAIHLRDEGRVALLRQPNGRVLLGGIGDVSGARGALYD